MRPCLKPVAWGPRGNREFSLPSFRSLLSYLDRVVPPVTEPVAARSPVHGLPGASDPSWLRGSSRQGLGPRAGGPHVPLPSALAPPRAPGGHCRRPRCICFFGLCPTCSLFMKDPPPAPPNRTPVQSTFSQDVATLPSAPQSFLMEQANLISHPNYLLEQCLAHR